MKSGYGEFCPIAKASEIFATRRTPLVLRELMLGAHNFNDIHRGVPLMSRTLLAERLRHLEQDGIITKRTQPDGSTHEYWLTPSGEAFHDVLRDLSRWGLAHARDRLAASDLNPGLLMWRMRKRVDISALPEHRVVIRFEFSGVPRSRTALRVIWLVLERTGADICFKDPGYAADLTVRGDVAILVRLYLGYVHWHEVAGKTLSIEGDRQMARQLPLWLQLHRQLGRDYLPFGRPAA
ncbi:winged helix-turn-helix transcriptional regulator [Bradyrhizobium paxllaeri]|uniref:winged helix-turn-helix transcriptional regulator n=1 Tax=Bradyrhizobium paxllaeri TaxID=190148 RepID=UPI0008104535|nr:helix-turn-helix domain-containing protein [Bradyrhizobium paxllaeri]